MNGGALWPNAHHIVVEAKQKLARLAAADQRKTQLTLPLLLLLLLQSRSRRVRRRGAIWCGVVWCGMVWCGVVCCFELRCGVTWWGMAWCGSLGHLSAESAQTACRLSLMLWCCPVEGLPRSSVRNHLTPQAKIHRTRTSMLYV